MSKKLLSAVLAIAMVVSLCASLFTVSTSAATNYESDRAALKEAIVELFVKGPTVEEDTIDFLTAVGILTVVKDCNGNAVTTVEEQLRNQVFVVADAICSKCGASHNYVSNSGKVDGSNWDYFKKADSTIRTDIDALIREAASAYYFGQKADDGLVDATFDAGRNTVVKKQLSIVNGYIASLEAEVGALEDKPAKYKADWEDWVSKYHANDGQYNPNFGINPYGNYEYDKVDWFEILKGYAGTTLGWISFDTIRNDSTNAVLLNNFERLYRAAQTLTLKGVLYYDFACDDGKMDELDNAWEKLVDALKVEIKWDLPSAASAKEQIKGFNNLKKVIEFFENYIVDAYLNIYTSTNVELYTNVTMAKGIVEFVEKQGEKAGMYIYAICASSPDYFNNLVNAIVAGIASLDPAASMLALSDEDIANGVDLVNEATALYNAYSDKEVFTKDGKEYNDEWKALKAAIDAFKVLLPYDASSMASYKVVADSSAAIKDLDTKTDVKANDSFVITFAPNYFAYTRYLIALQEALEDYVVAIGLYNGALEELDKVSSASTHSKADLEAALEALGFIVGTEIVITDGKLVETDIIKKIAQPIIVEKFIPEIVYSDYDNEGIYDDDKAAEQWNVFKGMFEAAVDYYKNEDADADSSWDWETGSISKADNKFTKKANELYAYLPYITAQLEELINVYFYTANVIAAHFGVDKVVTWNSDLADYQNPANYVGFDSEIKKVSGANEAVTVADLLAEIAKYLDFNGTLELADGQAKLDNEMVKAIFTEINAVIAWYNANLANKDNLPEIVLTTQDVEDLITYYIENEAEVKAQIDSVVAELEAAIETAFTTVLPNDEVAIGYATMAYGFVQVYNGYAGYEAIDLSALAEYVSMEEINGILESGDKVAAVKALAASKINEVIDSIKAQLAAVDSAEALYAVLVAVNDLLDWYNANLAGKDFFPEIELLPTDVYSVEVTVDIDDVWAALTADIDGSVVTDFVKPGETSEFEMVTEGDYFDMMVNYFKLFALCAPSAYADYDYDEKISKYETKVSGKALDDAYNAFIASVKALLTDDRGDELIEEFESDLINWVSEIKDHKLATSDVLAEKLVEVFGAPADCSALALPTDAAEPYLYYNFTLAHVVNHDIPANKYAWSDVEADNMYNKNIYSKLVDKSKKANTDKYNVSEYDTEWTDAFRDVRETAGYVLELLVNAPAITSDIPLWKVLAVIESLDAVLDTQSEHHVDALAAYKAAVLDPAIAAASGKNVYDYVDTDASHKVWANSEAAYAAAVAAKYDTRMPKSKIDAIVETLNKAVASLELVKKPESSATVADLEAKIAEAEALVVKADDLDTANKVARLDDLKNAIADAKQFIVDLKYVTNYNTYDIEAQIAALQAAMDIVVESQTFADDLVSYLTFVFNAVQAYYSEYTEESFAAFSEAWQAAQKVAADTSLKASAYVAARASVAAAYDALEVKPEPTMTKTFEAAVAKLAELKAVSTEGYTAESVAAFNAAVAALEAGINEVAADDALLELIANAYIAKASLSAEVDNPVTCD